MKNKNNPFAGYIDQIDEMIESLKKMLWSKTHLIRNCDDCGSAISDADNFCDCE